MTPSGYAALPHIYDAATNMGRWKRALDACGEAIGASAITLTIRQPDMPVKDIYLLSSRYLDFSRSMSGIYYGLWLGRLQKADWEFLSRQPVHVPKSDTEIGPSAIELDRRRDYAFLRKKLGISRRLGVRLNADCMWFDAMSIVFHERETEISEESVKQTISLLPHITKAVEIGRTFSMLRSRYRAALATLDHVQVGMAVALPSGEIVVHNSEASRILRNGDGLALTRSNTIIANDSTITSKIEQSIREACGTAIGEGNTPECLFPVTRPSGEQDFLIDIAPLKDSMRELDRSLHGSLITIIDPLTVPVPRTDRFAQLYGLTSAESEVLGYLIGGSSLEDIADKRNTSPITTRNQVAAILEKTGTRRRADLIRLLIRVMPPIK